MSTIPNFDAVCPIPISDYPTVTLAHGGGGKLTQQLVEKLFMPLFKNDALETRHDGAVFKLAGSDQRLAFSTDSYVVKPIFFPGGDIGSLAVNGTVNDLLMCGACPLYLSAGFILEEGLPMESLWRVIQSMSFAAKNAGVQIVTGDTKVVDKGKGDGIFITTAGVGQVDTALTISPSSVRAGDVIILNGDIGRHGIAILAAREGLSFETTIQSDCAPLNKEVNALLAAGIEIHCLRDLTRGGLASATVEIAQAAGLQITLDEAAFPVREDVQGACEIMGFDPIYVANEGRFITFVASHDAQRALSILKSLSEACEACVIGTVVEGRRGRVVAKNRIGSMRVIDMISGEQLPRIC